MMTSLVPIGSRLPSPPRRHQVLRGQIGHHRLKKNNPIEGNFVKNNFETVEADFSEADFTDYEEGMSYPFKAYQKTLKMKYSFWTTLDYYA